MRLPLNTLAIGTSLAATATAFSFSGQKTQQQHMITTATSPFQYHKQSSLRTLTLDNKDSVRFPSRPYSDGIYIQRQSTSTSTQLQLSPIDIDPEPIRAAFTNLFQFSGNVPILSSLALNTILFFSLKRKLDTMLTPEGFAHSLALGTMLWTTLGWRGWTVCVLYLFLGQLVTKVGFAEKEALGIAEGRGGRRGPENVWGSAFTGVCCAAAAAQGLKSGGGGEGVFLGLATNVWILGYVASLATKLADTFASEIGKAYGKTTFLITTLQPAERGAEGAVSLEGTLASVVGGLALSLYAYFAVGLIPTLQGVGVSTFAAFFGTMVESLIGATLQEKEGFSWMSNEVVNFFNTLIGAATAMLLGVLVLGM